MNGEHKIQFMFTEDALTRLNDLEIKSGSVSKAEVIRRALRVYEWLWTLDADADVVIFTKERELVRISVGFVRVG